MAKDDSDSEKVVVVRYTFTNNSKGAVAEKELQMRAFQDGVELQSSGFYRSGKEKDGWRPIKPGRSITSAEAFYLYDAKAPVTVAILTSDGVIVDKALSLK